MTGALVNLVLGLATLTLGAELLVRSASTLARRLGIPPLIIGLTVVAMGTSAPELAVSLGAAWSGQGDLAVGNVIGSNIFNVLLILGLSALITPLVVAQQLIRLDVPILVGVSSLTWLLALDGCVSLLDGVLLVSMGGAYIAMTIWLGWRASGVRNRPAPQTHVAQPMPAGTLDEVLPEPVVTSPWLNGLLLLCGLVLLVLGSRWLVSGASDLARWLGMSELVIGLTIVAAGTSLPEVAASVMASLRGQRDMAVGNVVGSNLFNLLLILGLAAVASPRGMVVPAGLLHFDLPVMVGVAVACLPVFFTGQRISRWEGLIFLGYYAAYLTYVLMQATGHNALPLYHDALMWFVLPLTLLTLGMVMVRAIRAGRGPHVNRASSDGKPAT